jgi:hypothetical protein
MRGFADFRSSMLFEIGQLRKENGTRDADSCVLILSNGVTASKDSVAPAPKPAMTFAGPETLPSASASIDLY